MKANELMIGDLAQTKFECPFKVLVLGCGTISDNLEEDVIPIPLTEDILKANADGGSCSFDEFRSLYHLKCNGYHREISIEFDKTWFVPFVEITGMGRTAIKVNMQYVHELQHALRLCGLSDVADNFKIE